MPWERGRTGLTIQLKSLEVNRGAVLSSTYMGLPLGALPWGASP